MSISSILGLFVGLFILRLFASLIISVRYESKIGYTMAKTIKRTVLYEERQEQAARMRGYVRKVADNRWIFSDAMVTMWITNYCNRFDTHCIQRDTEELLAYVNVARPLRNKRNQKKE